MGTPALTTSAPTPDDTALFAKDFLSRVANDATLGVMAESMFGAGVGSDDVVYLNGSTAGLGGGVVTGGHIVTGVRGGGAGPRAHR